MGQTEEQFSIPREELEKLLGIMDKESRLGYGDSAVFGGFCRFLLGKLRDLGLHGDCPEGQRLLDLLIAYSRGSIKERQELLATIRSFISEFAENADPAPGQPEGKMAAKAPDSLRWLKNVGPKRQLLLRKMGIANLHDLLFHFPRRHEDRRVMVPIAQLLPGEMSMVYGRVIHKEAQMIRKNLNILKAHIRDESGTIIAVWFNQMYLKDQMKAGDDLYLYGRLELKYNRRQFIVSEFEFDGEASMGNRILPVYGLSEGLSQKMMRQMMVSALEMGIDSIIEYLPQAQREAWGFPPLQQAVADYHFPLTLEDLERARRRLVFDEFFLARLGMDISRQDQGIKGIVHRGGPEILDGFHALLPFTLTQAQNRSIAEIYGDMERAQQMNRLLEGDVGSGKTLVAAAAIYKAWRSGYQAALMAPTEILARQHDRSLRDLFAALPMRIAFLSGATKAAERREIYRDIDSGKIDLLIGTHAMLFDKTHFAKLGLIVIDEQHRFGVRQREKLRTKGLHPDILTLTATPIPRTLALTVFAGQSLSVLDEMPPDRKPVTTILSAKRDAEKIYDFIKKAVAAGRQAYVICPLIEESETLDLQAAENLYRDLKHGAFQDIPIALLHGRMAAREKEDIMTAFYQNALSVLISTTVIEVGVDVPNATVMMVKDAHRFGLAQLHQIRGRIGRGGAKSYCILEHDGGDGLAYRRLEVIKKYQDGFKIAEEDLKLRGPGDFFGVRQHGLPEMKIADLFIDHEVLADAAEKAKVLLSENPSLAGDEWEALRCLLAETYTLKQ